MEKTRRQFTPQQKVAILREHLVEHMPVSDLCDKHKLHPTLFYRIRVGKANYATGDGIWDSPGHGKREWNEQNASSAL
jgi:hypothetical protein